jgi:ribosomal protein S18 acetylase RimI-like enzyme
MIRDSTSADIPRLKAIRSVVFPESSPQLLVYGIRGPALTLVACDDLQLSGYALALTSDQRAGAYLAELAVAPGARRQGYGRALLEAVTHRVAAHDHLELTTRATDDRARAFYRAAGFSSVEWLSDYYNNGDDGVRLLRDL